MLSSNIFTVKHCLYREDENVCKGMWTGFCLGGGTDCSLYHFMSDAFDSYCRRHDFFVCYFLIDCIMAIGYEEVPAVKAEIDSIPPNNQKVMQLWSYMRERRDYADIDALLEENDIHKLSYKTTNTDHEKYVEEVLQYLIE